MTTGKNTSGGNARQATRPVPSKVRELLNDQANGLPVWIRAPKQGVEFYTGFSRAKLYELAGAAKIRSVSIRGIGQGKGTRLFHLQSVLDFIAKCEQQGAVRGIKFNPLATLLALTFCDHNLMPLLLVLLLTAMVIFVCVKRERESKVLVVWIRNLFDGGKGPD
jgi:hypothetical protein